MRRSRILICVAFLLGSAACRSPVVDVDVKALGARASALDRELADVDNPAPEQRRFREAGELRKQILDYDRATLDANSLVLADAMDRLAWDHINDAMLSKGMLHQIDRPNALYAEATKLLRSALTIDEHADPPDNEAAQLAEASSTEEAVAAMAVRLASSDNAMAKLIRDRDDAQLERQRIEASLTNALGAGARDASAEDAIRRDLAAADARLSALDATLRQGYPQYAEIANPLAVSIGEAQKLLDPDEALMTYFISDGASFLWVVRPDRSALIRLPIGHEQLLSDVAFLRRGLDPTGRTIRTPNDIPRFDIAGAFDLYGKIFAPAMPLLEGVKSILVVPDGALQSLPLAVLVTDRPAGPASGLSAYRSVPWLARRFAITVLPAVLSLRALRVFAHAAHPSAPFAGFGDPLFDGDAGGARGVETTRILRGAQVDLTELRKLPRLAETAGELREEARALSAPDSAVHLREDATVSEVKHADLSDTRIIAFATHGLVAGDLPLLAEPALALTPPRSLTQEDTGLLKASDVTQLKLNADWVVLSACNTAASDGSEGAEGLSGLAKAFFYAGARAVLVSHWPVNSRAAVKLTTGTFDALAREPTIGRAEALRRAMLAMIDATGNEVGFEFQSHPMFWAPFVIVGEGGAGR